MKSKLKKRITRHRRIRARVSGTAERPRLSVFRSNKHIWAQLIDDEQGKTIVSASDLETREKGKKKEGSLGEHVGALVAKKAEEKKVVLAVFDRGGYKYHGTVRAVAEGARKGGLKF